MKYKELKSFKDLNVWQKASDLASLVYSITEKFPKSELYGITNQMRRAVISISSNIAEGFKRNHKKEKLQFYNIAYSSVAELESQIEITYKLNFLAIEDYQKLIFSNTEVSKMMGGLIGSLNSKSYILNSHAKSGQSLVEAMIAMSIIIFGILGVYGLAARGISLNRVIADRYTATYLASEGVEVVKNMIDANVLQKKPWNDGLADGNYEVEYNGAALQPKQDRVLLYDQNNGLYSYAAGGKETTLRRVITIATLGNGEELKVNSQVSWRSRGGDFQTDLEDHFFNWK